VLAAPGVNAQVHQHMFCARLDMAVDGHNNMVEEVDVLTGVDMPGAERGEFDNVFGPVVGGSSRTATRLTLNRRTKSASV
jgi:primary-amine oxidase